MKKITLLCVLLQVSLGFSQNAPIDFETGGFGATWTWATFEAPTGATNPTFTVEANPFIDATNGSATVAKIVIDYATSANWGSAGCESAHDADLGAFTFTAANSIVKMLVYQEGFAAPVALKFATNTSYALAEVVVPNTVADAWVEVQFDLSAWIGDPNGSPDQIIFFPSYAPRATGHTVYFDNVTFNAQPLPAGDPMVSAPDPTIDESMVLSAYSNYYMTNTVANFNLNEFQGAGTISEVDIESDGNLTAKIEGLTFYGAKWDAVDLSSYMYVHLDYWATSSTAFNFYLIDATAGIPGGNAAEPRYSFALSGGDETLVQGEWKSVFIPLQHFLDYPSTGFTYDLTDIFQWKFDGNGTLYFDNVYFTTDINSSIADFTAESFRAYPNPTLDSWTVKSPNTSISSIQVFDISGKIVSSSSFNRATEATIDGTLLTPGIYFVQIETPVGLDRIKLIKK